MIRRRTASVHETLGCILAAGLLLGCASCDPPDSPSARASLPTTAATTTSRPAIAEAGSRAEVGRDLAILFDVARRRDFEKLFALVARFGRQVEQIASTAAPGERADRERQYKVEQAALFRRHALDDDLQMLLVLLHPGCTARVLQVREVRDFGRGDQRCPRALVHEVRLTYGSPAASPLIDGRLVRETTLNVVLDGATGQYLTSELLPRGEAVWDVVPLNFYALSTQSISGGFVVEARVLGGRPPINVMLRCGVLMLAGRIEPAAGGGMFRQVRWAVPQRAAGSFPPPSQWTLTAYDTAGEVIALRLGGSSWTVPDGNRAWSENRAWWINWPWNVAGRFNQLPGIYEAWERDLLYTCQAISGEARERLIAQLNDENEVRLRQHSQLKTQRLEGRTVTQLTLYPGVWSVPILLPGDFKRWQLDTSGRQVDILLSTGERFPPGQQSEIPLSPGVALHFMSADSSPAPVTLTVFTR